MTFDDLFGKKKKKKNYEKIFLGKFFFGVGRGFPSIFSANISFGGVGGRGPPPRHRNSDPDP